MTTLAAQVSAEVLTPGNALPVSALAVALNVIGLIGIVVPVLPGLLLCWAGVAIWAWSADSTVGWTALAVATLILIVGTAVKYLIPGRQMRRAGVPWSTLTLGAIGGVIGFFVIPVVGFFVGFVLAVYASELIRTDRSQAWPRTVTALKGIGISMLIELVTGVMIASTLAAAFVAA